MPIADSTKKRARNFVRLALIPESWFLEILFVIGLAGIYRIFVERNDVMETFTWAFGVVLGLLSVPAVQLLMIPFAIFLFWRGVRRLEEHDQDTAAKETAVRAAALTEVTDTFGARFAALDILTDFAASDYEYRLTAERVFAIRPKIETALNWVPRTEFSRESEGPSFEGNHMFSLLASDAAWIGQDYPRPVFETMQHPVLVEHERSFVKVRTYDATSNANFEAVLQSNKDTLRNAHEKLEQILTSKEQSRTAQLSELRRIRGKERI